MKKYWAVSMVFTKIKDNSTVDITNSLVANLEAQDKEQAFGRAYKQAVEYNKGYQLFNYSCVEQKDNKN